MYKGLTSYIKMRSLLQKKIKAYTLTEILVVLVIIGILVLLALPNLMPLITKAKTTEAKLQLEHLAKLQQSYFYEHSRYATDLAEIGFIQEKLTTDEKDGKANYKIEIVSANNNAFIAKATAVADFDGDGVFNVWQIDQDRNLKEITPD
ncbi:type IV pilin protein [Pedobacter sp. ASV28]|uniref:type IV pilin protein n=1 Tax=Pedobacter sp. ASV28 TaxID=2795123 RepID=UPI001E28F42F|nr:type II secretion system protein [Pedobacter sp. ASV28]